MSEQPTLPTIDMSLDAYVDDAIRLLQQALPKDGRPYYGCFSGGKDSCVIKELARLAEVPVVWHYNVTTIDPPELVYFIREHHPDVIWERPEKPFFTLAKTKGFPTRRVRWCCKELKEANAPSGERMVFGIRASESPRRAKHWRELTWHRYTKEYAVCPIVRWSDAMVWEFIRGHNLPYCVLYDEGFHRLGCVGCPMATTKIRKAQFSRWPRYHQKWKSLFRDTWEQKTGTTQRDGQVWFGDRYFATWMEMWEWWLNDEPLPNVDEPCLGMLEFFS